MAVFRETEKFDLKRKTLSVNVSFRCLLHYSFLNTQFELNRCCSEQTTDKFRMHSGKWQRFSIVDFFVLTNLTSSLVGFGKKIKNVSSNSCSISPNQQPALGFFVVKAFPEIPGKNEEKKYFFSMNGHILNYLPTIGFNRRVSIV